MTLKTANMQLKIGLFLLGFMIFLGVVFLLFGNFAIHINLDTRWQQSSSRFLLGADELGRDLLSCVVYGAGVSLLIGFAVVMLSSFIGVVWGLVSGMAGGITDMILMRIVDIFLAFPGILLAIALAAFFSPGIAGMVFILTFSSWAGYARLVRGEVLKHKHKEFILAARSYNASFMRIIFSHLLPLIKPIIFVQASLGAAGVIIAESSLNFLGLGLDPETPTLGQLIDTGVTHIFDRPVFIVVPGIVLFIIIISLNFIGEGLSKGNMNALD
ncbi:MAG: ABC transporter permease [Candidatus Aminicenantes bacterium]|nr:ABC transporter permease [Candidatus Aminicenantes bacterium]